MDLNETYKQLTNVDIEEQRQIWDSRAIGYYGEYLLFCELYKGLTGQFKILMNLNIPTEDNTTTEIDLMLIHETGIYIFECKHYSGIIYGTDTDENWTQFFKTAPNNSFKNPISQNGYHMRAVKKLYPDIPVYSFVVFTSDNCTLKTANSNPNITICKIDKVTNIIYNKYIANKTTLMLDTQIDNIFCALVPYSPMKQNISEVGKTAPFYAWLLPTISSLETIKSDWQKEKETQVSLTNKMKSEKKKWTTVHILTIIACIIVLIIAILGFRGSYNSLKSKNTAELETFKQKFKHIDEINNEYIDSLKTYVKVSDVNILPLTEDAVSFEGKLSLLTDGYRIEITEDAKYIVMTDTGLIYEYNLFGGGYRYKSYSNYLQNGLRTTYELPKSEFYGINDTTTITYIKVTGVELKKDNISNTLIKDNLEIELYKK